LPSVASSHRSEVLSLSSMLYVVTSTATQLPSGDSAGLPTRLTFHRSSTVIGRFLAGWPGAVGSQTRPNARVTASVQGRRSAVRDMGHLRVTTGNPRCGRLAIVGPRGGASS